MPKIELSQEELARLAFQDDLTSLYNRRYLYNYLANKIDWAKSDSGPFSLIMFDMDFFKEINDTYGHLTGDHALKHLAQVIKDILRPNDIPIRYGGDEFTVLMPGTDKTTACQLGETMRQKIKDSPLAIKDDKSISMSISGGVASFPQDAHSPEQLIDEADKELYLSKRSGRNRISGGAVVDQELVSEREFRRMKTIPCPVIIGRNEVLKTLSRVLASVTEGENGFILLEGDTGVGKTRILKELDKNLNEQFSISFIRCNEPDRAIPYKPIIAFFKQLIDKKIIPLKTLLSDLSEKYQHELKKVLPALFPKSKETAAAASDAVQDRKLLFEALRELFARLSKKKPLLLLLDEFQNIDLGSLEIINGIIGSDHGHIVFMGTLRASYLGRSESAFPFLARFLGEVSHTGNFQKITVTNLGQPETSRIISTILAKRKVVPEFDEKVYKTTRGNPLFIEELIKNFILKKYLVKGKEWEFRNVIGQDWITSLDALIRENLTLLDKTTARIVDEAAVVGTEIDLSILKGVDNKNAGETLEILDKAKKARVIEEIDPLLKPDQFTFVNQRIQEVTYEALDQDTRKTLHGKIGEIEEKLYASNLDEAAPALAFHFAQAGNKTKAANYEKRAGELAQNIFRSEEAGSYRPEKRGVYKARGWTRRSKISEVIASSTPAEIELRKLKRELLKIRKEKDRASAEESTASQPAKYAGTPIAWNLIVLTIGILLFVIVILVVYLVAAGD